MNLIKTLNRIKMVNMVKTVNIVNLVDRNKYRYIVKGLLDCVRSKILVALLLVLGA